MTCETSHTIMHHNSRQPVERNNRVWMFEDVAIYGNADKPNQHSTAGLTNTSFIDKGNLQPVESTWIKSLSRLRNHAFILPRPDIIKRTLKVPLRSLKTRVRFRLAGLQVRVDQFDKSVHVLCRDGLVLLVEVIHVAVQDLDE